MVITPDVYTSEKFVSASAEVRAREFLELWTDEKIKHVLIACGGEFLMETLPYLEMNKDKIKNANPKWVQGFSDVSLLLFYLTTNYDFSTIHANSFSSYAMKELHDSLLRPLNFVKNCKAFEQESFELYEIQRNREIGHECDLYNLTEKVEYKNIKNGNQREHFSGRLLGGCVDVLKTIIGTPFDSTRTFCLKQSEGIIWYLENCEMSLTELKRTLWQMQVAGWFDNANGFLIGRTNSSETVRRLGI